MLEPGADEIHEEVCERAYDADRNTFKAARPHKASSAHSSAWRVRIRAVRKHRVVRKQRTAVVLAPVVEAATKDLSRASQE